MRANEKERGSQETAEEIASSIKRLGCRAKSMAARRSVLMWVFVRVGGDRGPLLIELIGRSMLCSFVQTVSPDTQSMHTNGLLIHSM